VYYHHPQVPWYSSLAVVVRTSGDPAALVPLLRATVREMEPAALITDVRPMQERIDQSLGSRRLAVFVLSGFAALTLVLALLGIYGMISYGLAQRRQEIGIRLALGATPSRVTRMLVRQGMSLALVGLAAGALTFVALGRVLNALLYEVSPRDPATLLAGIAIVAAIAMFASWVPARRAGFVGAEAVLRGE
jgi:ABC-type antimicrobial peptide transport system permease subunit